MLQETQSIQDDDELLLNLVISEIRCDPDPGRRILRVVAFRYECSLSMQN